MNTLTRRRVVGCLMRTQKQLESAISALTIADGEIDDEVIKGILATIRNARRKLALRIDGMQRDMRRKTER